jgi:hypothetical protein
VDLVEATLKASMGDSIPDMAMTESSGVWSNYMILSTKSGIFKDLVFESDFEKNNLLEIHCTAKKGDRVEAYRNTSHSLGTILFRASSVKSMIEITANMEKYYHVEVE